MNDRSLEILEYYRVRETIAGYCMSEEGKSLLLEKKPWTDPVVIKSEKMLSQSYYFALLSESPPPFKAWPSVASFLSSLRVEGASLDIEQLYALMLMSESALALRQWGQNRLAIRESKKQDILAISSSPENDKPLQVLIQSLPDLSEVQSSIARVIDKSGEIRDLPEIRAIKESIKNIRSEIERLVFRYMNDESLKIALQAEVPTIRNSRQVIPIKANYRGRVRGIVHEVSQSGQTVYVEPEDVIDKNNDLVAEEHRLSREIARILRELTAKISAYYEDIYSARTILLHLDTVGASARWAHAYHCVYAQEGNLQLRKARHPLLGSKAVPIDLVLQEGSRMLIITGPNTGGKTVSLKTVALFALLNQSGWPLPCAAPTVFPIFDFIGCDIGDEQSLDQSLSTFSAHMKNISSILNKATEKSLILLDELGSGTDPQEGSAIAMAVLDSLIQKKSLVLVTTHHGILKNYGYTQQSCINASVDFDQNTLSPTYRIVMGVPGESHALDIALRNGLEASIVEQARSYLVNERADISALIKGLTEKHEELSKFEKDKQTEEQELREKRRKSDLKELQLKQRELELREQGFRKLNQLLSESRKQLENLVREVREGELTRDKTLAVKSYLSSLEATVLEEYSALEDARTEVRLQEKQCEELLAQESKKKLKQKTSQSGIKKHNPRTEILPDFAPGVEVYIGPSKRRGVLVRQNKKGFWEVLVDSVRLTCDPEALSSVPVSGEGQKQKVEIKTDIANDEKPAFELRLLGMRLEEAKKAVQKQLDLASMQGLHQFSIVHGKGHGVLQEAVQEILKKSPFVSSFSFAHPEDGGTGKTLVSLIR